MSENGTIGKRRGGIMQITAELLHDVLKLPDTVKIRSAMTVATLSALQDGQIIGIMLEGPPMPEVGEGERIPEVQAVYNTLTLSVGPHKTEDVPVLEKFQRRDAKRDEWVRLA